ncbi:MAG: glycosyltransferase [Candidatus Thermoplasmatota archaeon]
MMVKYLSDELMRRGHEVAVFSNPSIYRLLKSAEPKKDDRTDAPSIHACEYSPLSGRLELFADYFLGLSDRASKHLRTLVRDYRPDVVHWHNTKGFMSTPVRVDGPISLYTAHDYYAFCPRTNLITPNSISCLSPAYCQLCLLRWHKLPQPWRCGGRRVLRLPSDTRVIAPSQYMATRLEAEGIKSPRVIRNFVLDRGIVSGPTHRDSMTYLGVLEPHKGLGTLMDAFMKSASSHDFNLNIIGQGSMKGSLESRASKSGLSDRIRIHGFIPYSQLDEILRGTAALLVPSEWPENSPLVVLEALSKGIPVIGSRVGGLPEIINEASGSLLFEPGDVTQLSEAMQTVWSDGDFSSTRQRKARVSYESMFTPDAHINAYLRLIHSI